MLAPVTQATRGNPYITEALRSRSGSELQGYSHHVDPQNDGTWPPSHPGGRGRGPKIQESLVTATARPDPPRQSYGDNTRGRVSSRSPRAGSRSGFAAGRPQEKPRFIHDGVLYHYQGSVFDKLQDPALYTGSHKQRFDEFGKGKGLIGRDSASIYSQWSTGENRNGDRWRRGLREEFYRSAEPPVVGPAGSFYVKEAVRSRSGSVGATTSGRSTSVASKVPGHRPNAAHRAHQELDDSFEDHAHAPAPRFEAWQLNSRGELVLDEQRTYLMNYGPGFTSIAPALREETYEDIQSVKDQRSSNTGLRGGPSSGTAPSGTVHSSLDLHSVGPAARSLGSEAVRRMQQERRTALQNLHRRELAAQEWGATDRNPNEARWQEDFEQFQHDEDLQDGGWGADGQGYHPPEEYGPQRVLFQEADHGYLREDPATGKGLPPMPLVKTRREQEEEQRFQTKVVDKASGDLRALEPWERLALQRSPASPLGGPSTASDSRRGELGLAGPQQSVSHQTQDPEDDEPQWLRGARGSSQSSTADGRWQHQHTQSHHYPQQQVDSGWVEDHSAYSAGIPRGQGGPAQGGGGRSGTQFGRGGGGGGGAVVPYPLPGEPSVDEIMNLVDRYQRYNKGNYSSAGNDRTNLPSQVSDPAAMYASAGEVTQRGQAYQGRPTATTLSAADRANRALDAELPRYLSI